MHIYYSFLFLDGHYFLDIRYKCAGVAATPPGRRQEGREPGCLPLPSQSPDSEHCPPGAVLLLFTILYHQVYNVQCTWVVAENLAHTAGSSFN